jgi:hypothetical protein
MHHWHTLLAGADPGGPSTFPAVKRALLGVWVAACQIGWVFVPAASMVTRGDILWLGVASGVTGSLIGGLMLGIGMDLIVNGAPLGWLLLLPAAPVSAFPGWMLARKLVRQL